MKTLIYKLHKLNWCSMMIENCQHQSQNMRTMLRESTTPRQVMDRTQIWENTPQGHRYWSRISNDLYPRG